jgi:hypothetical protein
MENKNFIINLKLDFIDLCKSSKITKKQFDFFLKKININTNINTSNFLPFHSYCMSEHCSISILLKFLNNKYLFNTIDISGCSPFHIYCNRSLQKQHYSQNPLRSPPTYDGIAYFLKAFNLYHQYPTLRDCEGFTPFHIYCSNKDIKLDILKLFLKWYPKEYLNIPTYSMKYTPLHLYCANTSITDQGLKYLLQQNNIDANMLDLSCKNAFIIYMDNPKSTSTGIKYFLKYKNINLHHELFQNNPFRVIINHFKKDVEIFKLLLQNDTLQECELDDSIWSPIEQLCVYNNININKEIQKILLLFINDYRFSVNNRSVFNTYCSTPNINIQTICAFLRRGDLNMTLVNEKGHTFLHNLCSNKHITNNILYIVLEHASDQLINYQTSYGETPLSLYCSNPNITTNGLHMILHRLCNQATYSNSISQFNIALNHLTNNIYNVTIHDIMMFIDFTKDFTKKLNTSLDFNHIPPAIYTYIIHSNIKSLIYCMFMRSKNKNFDVINIIKIVINFL